jgi:sugar transferase (PEP-CTERM/EpsH1 system associated)
MDDLLFLAHRIPYPPNKGEKLRSYHILKFLSERYHVHLGCFIDDKADLAFTKKVSALCYETCFVEQSKLVATVRSATGFLTGEALSLPYYRDRSMSKWVAVLLRQRKVRAAIAFSSPLAQYLMPGHGLRRVVDFVDVDSEKWMQYAQGRCWPKSSIYRREARHLLAYERHVAHQFERGTFVSSAQAALFRRLAPEVGHKVDHFCNGVDVDYFSPHILRRSPSPAGQRHIVFTGAMDYWPNIDAVDWFANLVLPTLQRAQPNLCFTIVGAHPTAAVTALGRLPGVTVTGSVPDTRPYLAHATVAVAPLRIARGVQNKVLEAMSMQKTFVVSPQALEGIAARHGNELLVADGASQFIDQIGKLLAAPHSRALGLAARARVLADFSWKSNLSYLSAILGHAGEPVRPVAECAK